MSSGGERHSGDCQHGHLYDWCRKGGPCRTEELEREVATLRAERDAAVAAIRKHRDTPGDDRCWQDDDDLYAELCAARRRIAELEAEIQRLMNALRTLANWQTERRPGGSGEMCDFADAAIRRGE